MAGAKCLQLFKTVLGVVRVNPFQSALQRSTDTVFAPIVYRLAAHLDQLSVEEMLEDPAAAAYVLRNAQKLFDLPMVVNHFQLGIELESFSSQVVRDPFGMPTKVVGPVTLGRGTADSLDGVIDTAARLSVELQDHAGVVGVLTGPGTLMTLGDVTPMAISELYVAMAGKYSDARVAAILLAEAPTVKADAQLLAATTKELVNICRFYGLKSILLALGGGSALGPVDLVLGPGRVLPVDLLKSETPADISTWTRHKGVLLTAGEVPETLEPEFLKSWMNAFSRTAGRGSR